jgi:hypothetical protein
MRLDNLSSNQKNIISLMYFVLTVVLILAYAFDFLGPVALLALIVLLVGRAAWIWRFRVPDS